jgi:threonine synthase
MRLAARLEGIFISPEAGAAVAALPKLRASGDLVAGDEVVVFATGSGLKHLDRMGTGDAAPTDAPHA